MSNPHAAALRLQARQHRAHAERCAIRAATVRAELRDLIETLSERVRELDDERAWHSEQAGDLTRLANSIVADERRRGRKVA